MQQVKDCVRAAQLGVEWQLDGGDGSGGGAEGSSSSSSSSSKQMAAVEAGTAAGEGDAAGAESEQREAAAAAPFLSRGRVSLLGAIIAWVGIVGMFLSVLPRLYQRARRRPPAPDPSSKLSV